MIETVYDLQVYCRKFVPSVQLPPMQFEKVYLFVADPVVDTQGGMPYAIWHTGTDYRVCLNLSVPSIVAHNLNSRDRQFYHQTNHPFAFRNLSLYYLGVEGTWEDYESYQGLHQFNWEGVRDYLPFGDGDITVLRSAKSKSQERLDEVLTEFYIRVTRHIPVHFFPRILDLRPSPEVIRELFAEELDREVFFQSPLCTHVHGIAIEAGVYPDIKKYQDVLNNLQAQMDKALWDGSRPSVWDHLEKDI